MADAAVNRHQELILRWGKTTSFRVNWERRCHCGDTVNVTGQISNTIPVPVQVMARFDFIPVSISLRNTSAASSHASTRTASTLYVLPSKPLRVSSPQTTMHYSIISRWAILNLSIRNLSELTFGAVEVSALTWPVMTPKYRIQIYIRFLQWLICIEFDYVNMILWNPYIVDSKLMRLLRYMVSVTSWVIGGSWHDWDVRLPVG